MSTLRTLPVAAVAAVALASLPGCREEDPVRTVANPGAIPTMVTVDVDTYVSDSGYVKYHAVTDIWEVYDDTVYPHWRFPHPLVIDVLAPGMQPSAHVECDSAIYMTSKRLFRFDGNVIAVNINRDTFLTQQLYWDQTRTEFYTDSFIHIVKADRILEGYGFRSNERMTDYSILRPTAILPASSFRKGDDEERGRASAARDSMDRADLDNFVDPLDRPAPIPASRRGDFYIDRDPRTNRDRQGEPTSTNLLR